MYVCMYLHTHIDTHHLVLSFAFKRQNHFVGEANAAIHCIAGAYPGENTRLVCSLIGTVAGGIRWIRPDGKQVMLCTTDNSMCITDSATPGYRYVSNSTHVTLIIDSFNPKLDAGTWACRDGVSGVGEARCNKTEYSKYNVSVVSQFLASLNSLQVRLYIYRYHIHLHTFAEITHSYRPECRECMSFNNNKYRRKKRNNIDRIEVHTINFVLSYSVL